MEKIGSILIADDDKMTLDFFDITLSKLGFEIIKAVNGSEALEQLRLHDPDMILLDNKLPQMSGLEVTQSVRNDKKYKNFKNVPIIMFSAIDDPKEKVLGFETGIDDYITKPFNFSEVLARIRSVFRHKKLSDQNLLKENKLAVLESLNTNLIAFTKHIKKPLTSLFRDAKKIDTGDKAMIEEFFIKFETDYNEMIAMLSALEDEILEIGKKGDNFTKDNLTYKNLEEKINKYLKSDQNSV